MKKIVILICRKAANVCTGASCFRAFNLRSGAFGQYEGEEMELEAFCQCNGCDSVLEQDQGMQEKLERILDIHPDAVHIGICTVQENGGERCEPVKQYIKIFQEQGIPVIDGTHASRQYPNVGARITEQQ